MIGQLQSPFVLAKSEPASPTRREANMVGPTWKCGSLPARSGEAWRAANAGHANLAQRRVMTAIEICRAAARGGHVEHCSGALWPAVM